MIIGYFLIGVLYTLINLFIRKLNIEDDWGLMFMWILAWPLFFILLLISKISNKYE